MKQFSRFFRSEPLLFVLWANELVRLVWSPPELQTASGWLMILYVVLSLNRLRRGTFILCIPLALLAAGLAVWFDEWAGIMRGFQNGAVFMAFFGTIVLLRSVADQRPEISRARSLFTGLRTEETNGAFLVGSHIIGSVLVVGVLAVLAPILKDDIDDAARRRAAEVSQRGMCLAPLWSPFWVAAAFAAQQIPGVPAWEIMALGLGMAVVGLILAHLMYARGVGLQDLWRGGPGFRPHRTVRRRLRPYDRGAIECRRAQHLAGADRDHTPARGDDAVYDTWRSRPWRQGARHRGGYLAGQQPCLRRDRGRHQPRLFWGGYWKRRFRRLASAI